MTETDAKPKGKNDKGSLLMPLALIVVGIGWLLTTLGIAPEINWLWTIGLAAVGLLPLVLHGIDKFSMTVGPFFLIASVLSVARQTGKLKFDHEMPILVILAGVLMLIARHPAIPVPAWVVDPDKPN